MAGLDDQAQIRGKSTIVGSAGGFVILVGGRDVIGELAGALLNVTLVVGLAVILVRLGEDLGLIDRQDSTDECSVRDTAERVAGSADFLVDLEATTKTVETLARLIPASSLTTMKILTPGDQRSSATGCEPKDRQSGADCETKVSHVVIIRTTVSESQD